MKNLPHLLFVYGTLRSDGSANNLLADGEFIGHARTKMPMTVREVGGYPALSPNGSSQVNGELWAVDDEILAAIDEYEGPDLYRRQLAPILLPDGEVEAWVYFGSPT